MIDWRKITQVRQAARNLVHTLASAPEMVAVFEESFDDWPMLARKIALLATEDRGAALYTIHDVAATTGVRAEDMAPLIARGVFPGPIFDEPDMLWLRKDVVAWKAEQ